MSHKVLSKKTEMQKKAEESQFTEQQWDTGMLRTFSSGDPNVCARRAQAGGKGEHWKQGCSRVTAMARGCPSLGSTPGARSRTREHCLWHETGPGFGQRLPGGVHWGSVAQDTAASIWAQGPLSKKRSSLCFKACLWLISTSVWWELCLYTRPDGMFML